MAAEEINSKKRKIVHLLPIPIAPLIGPCLRCLWQARALKKQGWDITVVCLKIQDENELVKLQEPLFKDISLLPVLPNLGPPVLRELGTLLFAWRKISACIDMVRPDIVHVHNPPDTLAFVTALICSSKKIPLVYDIADSSKEVIYASDFSPALKMIYSKVALFFESQTMKRCSGIVTVSESLKKLIVDTRHLSGSDAGHFIVMRNIDEALASFTERKPAEEQDYLFYSGTLYSKFLGLEFLIESIEALLKKGDVRLCIAGDGPNKKKLEQLISDKKLDGSVSLLGHIPKDEIVNLIERAKMTVIPYERNSLTEISLPTKLFDYIALGKPVVYPDLPGFREVMGVNNEGKYEPGDKEDLLRVIQNILSDGEKRKLLGKKNKQLLENITFKKEFSRLLDLYNTILTLNAAGQ